MFFAVFCSDKSLEDSNRLRCDCKNDFKEQASRRTQSDDFLPRDLRMIFNSCFLTIIPFSRPNGGLKYVFFDYKMKTPSRTMRGRDEYHATEVIVIGCLREMSIHQKSGRNSEDVSKKASIRLLFRLAVPQEWAYQGKRK